MDDWSTAVVDGIDRLCCDGGVRDPEGTCTLVAATRSRARASAKTQAEAGATAEVEAQVASPARNARARSQGWNQGLRARQGDV